MQWQNRGGEDVEGEFVRIMENFDQLSEAERAEILQAANDPRVEAYCECPAQLAVSARQCLFQM